jgi:NHL repeat
MVFGRKQEASDEETGPLKHPNPPIAAQPGRFRQVTDVAFDAADNTYISDGYINSRVAKVDKEGSIYVADRSNHRMQVFDGEGDFQRQIVISVPVPPGAKPAIGNIPSELFSGGTFAPGSPCCPQTRPTI